MRLDDETSAEMEMLRRQRLWHAYTGSDRNGPRSPLRRGLVVSAVIAVLVLAGAFISGVIVAAREEATPPTTVVVPTTTTVPVPVTTAPPPKVAAPVPPTTVPSTTTTAPPPPPPPPPVTVGVSSTTPWTDAGIDVAAGEAVDVSASGVIAHNVWEAASRVGPDGDPRPDLGIYNLVDHGVRLTGQHGGLVARIGDGPAFLLGSGGRLSAPATGRLFLGVNDNGLDNNEGEFTVTVSRVAV